MEIPRVGKSYWRQPYVSRYDGRSFLCLKCYIPEFFFSASGCLFPRSNIFILPPFEFDTLLPT